MGTDKCSSTSSIVFCVFDSHCCQMTTGQNSSSENNAYATALMSRGKHTSLGVCILISFTTKSLQMHNPLKLSQQNPERNCKARSYHLNVFVNVFITWTCILTL